MFPPTHPFPFINQILDKTQGLLFYLLPPGLRPPLSPLTNECPYLASPDVLDSLEQANYIHEIKGHNPANCIPIALSTNKPKGSMTEYVPSFLLSNVMSLSPKIDEVREVIRCGNYEFVSLVETWLQSHIHDNVINIQGYNLIRRDRVEGIHGGVCVYIKDSMAFTVLDELYNSSFEILWINIRPNRLPRGIMIPPDSWHSIPPSQRRQFRHVGLSFKLFVIIRVAFSQLWPYYPW